MFTDNNEMYDLKYKSEYPQQAPEKNFINGLQNAHRLIHGLQKSIDKTSKYEKKLSRCRSRHHSECDKENYPYVVPRRLSLQGHTNPPQCCQISASTESNDCLQEQYTELSQRYDNLLRAFEERSCSLVEHVAQIEELRHETEDARAQLSLSHRNILTIGEKYLALNKRRKLQKCFYEAKLHHLCGMLHGVLRVAERSRCSLDTQHYHRIVAERDTLQAALISEMKRCSHLTKEISKLKNEIGSSMTSS